MNDKDKTKKELIDELEILRKKIEQLQQEYVARDEALTKAIEFADNIIDSSLDAIVVCDPTGCITRTNESFLKMFGYTEEELLGKHITALHPANEEIGQTLFAAKIKLSSLSKKMPFSDKQKSFDETIALLEQVIHDTRTLTFEMSIPILYELGIEAALEWLGEKTNADGEIAVTFKNDKKKQLLAEEVSIVLFRAVQELLTNVRKHAHAHNVEIAL